MITPQLPFLLGGFEIGSHLLTQDGFELIVVFLPQPLRC